MILRGPPSSWGLELESGIVHPEQLGLGHPPSSQMPALAFTFQLYVIGQLLHLSEPRFAYLQSGDSYASCA